MIKLSYILIFLLGMGSLYASDSLLVNMETDVDTEFDAFLIKEIEVAGNTHTKYIVIIREMKQQVGQVYDDEQLQEDRKRIQNLNIFSRVDIFPQFDDDGVKINILVAEQWHIFPYPILYRNELDWKKLSYGAGLLHDNVRGLNNLLMSSFWLGYNPGVDIYYSNPWFGGDKHFYYNIRAYTAKIKSKTLGIERFDEVHSGGHFTLGKRWGYHTYLSMTFTYRQVKVPAEYSFLTRSDNGSDHLPSLGLAFRYDKRDLWAYPKKGYYLDSYVTKTSNLGNIDYFRYGSDVRVYFPLYKGLSLGLRGAADLSSGSVPSYRKVYLGYAYRIRGEYDSRHEGDNRLRGNAELRFPILPVEYIDLGPGMAGMGGYGRNLPFGVSGAIFYDAGLVWYRSETWRDRTRVDGVGVGLHFHVPYVQLLRLETAWDRDGKQEYILDVGVVF